MDDVNIPKESKGWRPPLFIEFLVGSITLATVSKYLVVKGALISSPSVIYYTAIGLIGILFDKS